MDSIFMHICLCNEVFCPVVMANVINACKDDELEYSH